MTDNAALTDTSDMFRVHQVFRETLGCAPELLVEGCETRPERVEVLGSYYGNILEFLKTHHGGEDVLVYPVLLERVPEAQRELVSSIGGEHQALEDRLEAAGDAVKTFASDPGHGTRQAAVDALTTLDRELAPHLDREENEILPIAAAYITPEEWGALPGHGFAHFTGDKVWLILGLLRENMDDVQRAAMLEHMPPPAVDMWANMGNAAFDQMIGEVRQTA